MNWDDLRPGDVLHHEDEHHGGASTWLILTEPKPLDKPYVVFKTVHLETDVVYDDVRVGREQIPYVFEIEFPRVLA